MRGVGVREVRIVYLIPELEGLGERRGIIFL